MSGDYFQQSRELAALLRAHGFGAESEAVLNSIEGGSTGTEIHMMLRHYLRRIAADERVDAGVRSQADQIVREITAALGM
jgi:hypothetical protein